MNNLIRNQITLTKIPAQAGMKIQTETEYLSVADHFTIGRDV